MSVANLLTLLALLGGVVASAWTVYIQLVKKLDQMSAENDAKIKRVYTRQDEVVKNIVSSQKESVEKIEKEFMRVDAHNLSMEHIKEIMEIKSNATVQLFTTRLDNLTAKIDEFIKRMENRENGRPHN